MSFAFVASLFLLDAFLPRLQSYFLDLPNERSSHIHPIPRGGGFVFVLISSFSSLLSLFLIFNQSVPSNPLLLAPLFCLPLALIGFLDDRFSISAKWRYCAQLFTAFLISFMSPLLIPKLNQLPLFVLCVFSITAVINFINFMDGLDGLVSGCMAVAITSLAIELSAPFPIWALIGALLGFLVLNWTPAKVFMGDVGSTFLGGVFSVLVLQASTWVNALAFILVASPLLLDSSICVIRRFFSGHSVFQSHRLHLFQRLHQAGWSHSSVSCLYVGATLLLAVLLPFGGLPWLIPFAVFELLIGVWLDQRVAVPFVLPTRS